MQPSQNNPINHNIPVLPQSNLMPQPPVQQQTQSQIQPQIQQQILQPRQEATVYFKELKNKLLKIMFISLGLSALVFLIVISVSGYYEDEISVKSIYMGQVA
jgi:hypothetical protein